MSRWTIRKQTSLPQWAHSCNRSCMSTAPELRSAGRCFCCQPPVSGGMVPHVRTTGAVRGSSQSLFGVGQHHICTAITHSWQTAPEEAVPHHEAVLPNLTRFLWHPCPGEQCPSNRISPRPHQALLSQWLPPLVVTSHILPPRLYLLPWF